jgi:beta-galactosidase GanA
MRSAALLLAAASLATGLIAAPAATPSRTEPVQAIEFPYYLLPRALWERELVWIKGTGIDTVAFSIPWNWHQVGRDSYDFTGQTGPRRDLMGLIRVLRKAGMRAWIRPLPPVEGWLDKGWPAGAAQDPAA